MGCSIFKQYLNIYGVSDDSTLLISQITFLGYSFSGTRVFGSEPESKSKKEKQPALKYVMLYSTICLIGIYLCNLGVSYCGSGIFQVLYSSVTINTAVISYFVSGKKSNFTQIVGIVIIFGGLATSAVPSLTDSGDNILFGIFISLLGTFILSLSYIVDEYLVDNYDKFQISPKELSFKSGLLSFTILFVYQIFYVFPNFDRLTSSITDWKMVLFLFFCQFWADCLNNITYYAVVSKLGATACGVMQGLVSVGVFSLSAILFCSTQPHQCFTYFKGVATLIVVTGIITYSYGSSKKEKKD